MIGIYYKSIASDLPNTDLRERSTAGSLAAAAATAAAAAAATDAMLGHKLMLHPEI